MSDYPYECKYRTEEGLCNGHKRCTPLSLDACDEPVDMIQPVDMCANQSNWGNTYNYVTEEDIEALKSGKIIYINDGEYCHFIEFRQGEKTYGHQNT